MRCLKYPLSTNFRGFGRAGSSIKSLASFLGLTSPPFLFLLHSSSLLHFSLHIFSEIYKKYPHKAELSVDLLWNKLAILYSPLHLQNKDQKLKKMCGGRGGPVWGNLTESNTHSADSASVSRGLLISGGKHWSDLFDRRCPVLSFGFCVWVGGWIHPA